MPYIHFDGGKFSIGIDYDGGNAIALTVMHTNIVGYSLTCEETFRNPADISDTMSHD